MPTIIDGSTGVDTHKSGSVTQSDLAANVAGNGPAFRVFSNIVTQNVSNGIATKVQLNVKDFDTHNCFDSVTNFRFQPTVAGFYQLNGSIRVNGASLTWCYPTLFKSGAFYKNGVAISGVTAGSDLAVADLMYLNGTTDYAELFATVTGTNPSLWYSGVGAACYFSGYLVRSA